ncbi:hypothetical protein BWQ96_09911 [Gracilariopsis chorda]|uniref:Uncharacterized protein n=1 Tax=Gracilariopsis chorda TaxID=448386 RepID=A0A2V3IGV8_9FLOR|nr:hypothetical protein BWQ96_09911 [Gracilariopsis chorda]|eukprot:PXF40380.1 hypothetical protein BWQ96_09911 [Gracilariopsis chorda]
MGGFPGVTGLTVTLILYATGLLRMTGEPSTWVRENSEGQLVATYIECNRDEWSVYVEDEHGTNQQLGTWTQKVHHTSHPEKPLYNMTDAFAITGYGLTYATYETPEGGEGTFVKIWDEKEWQWARPDAMEVYLTETGRDQWSVYLEDGGLITIQIDYHTKEVTVTHSDYSAQYAITGAEGYRSDCNALKYCLPVMGM